MYNKLSFQQQLSQKYLNRNLIQIQKRKSLFPQQKIKVPKKRALTSIASQQQMHEKNWKLVKKLLQLKHNPGYIKRFMGDSQQQNKKPHHKKSRQYQSAKRPHLPQSLKQQQIEQQNKRLKKTIQTIKKSKKHLILPQI